MINERDATYPDFVPGRMPMTGLRGVRPGSGGELCTVSFEELYPICRSITGEGLRATLRRLGEIVPLELREVPTGTQVLDWTVPKEWNIRDAWIADSGRAIGSSISRRIRCTS